MTDEGRHDWWQEEYPPTKRCVDAIDSTYGSRRDAVAPHKKRGARARRTTSTVHAVWVVLEGDARRLPLTVFLPDGKEAIALFSGEEEARMFCHFRKKRGTSVNIRQTTAGRSSRCCTAPGVRPSTWPSTPSPRSWASGSWSY